MHRYNYVHLDIKPGNILVKNKHYKLCDFGLTVRVPMTSIELDQLMQNAAVNANTECATSSDPFTIVANNNNVNNSLIPTAVEEGDTRYMARELLDWGVKNLYKCDMFSFGLSVYEVCAGEKLPSEGDEWRALRNNEYSIPTKVSLTHTNLWNMLVNTLQADPTKRQTSTECISTYECLSERVNGATIATSVDTPSSVVSITSASATKRPETIKLSIETNATNPSPIPYSNEDLITPKQVMPTVFLNNMLVHNINNNNIITCSTKPNNGIKRAHTVI